MKKLFNNHSKTITFGGLIICLVLIVTLSINLFTMTTLANNKNYYLEPDVRPDIREDAVWDSELGMYVSGDYVKNAAGQYELNPDIFVSKMESSPEQEWLASHEDSEDEIDKAILYSLALLKKEPSTNNGFLSAICPRSSNAILTAMSTLPVSCYAEVWERICLEPAYRPQKLVALETFLGITINVGLYDSLGQHKWYESFSELKSDLKNDAFLKQVTDQNVEQYGNLLLPLLMRKAQNNTILDSELNVLEGMIEKVSAQLNSDDVAKTFSINASKDAVKWGYEHTQIIDVIEQIIESDYEWIK